MVVLGVVAAEDPQREEVFSRLQQVVVREQRIKVLLVEQDRPL
jgi:hypothetical protein